MNIPPTRKITVGDILHVRLRAPDLDRMEAFLTDLGLQRAARTETALYMRGTDDPHHIHITELGDPRVVGVAFGVSSEAELRALAERPDASAVESIDEPGGGLRVRLREPNGYQIEIVYGQERLEPIQLDRPGTNSAAEPNRRVGRREWGADRAAHVKRLGHVVLATPRPEETQTWFESLGLLQSDQVVEDDGSSWYSTFNRIDRGSHFVDHHTLLVQRESAVGWHHFAFEVQDVDDVLCGRAYLRKSGKWKMLWEGGRHGVGGQVGSYWADPWGRAHEIWSDGDRFNADVPVAVRTRSELKQMPRWNEPDPTFKSLSK